MQSKIILTVFIMIFTSLVTGCAATMPVPKMADPQRSAIGIQVATKSLFGTTQQNRVYFVKIDETDGITQNQVIPSNFIKDGRIYFLNAKPGKYAAVASLEIQTGYNAPTYHRYSFFSKEQIEATIVDVQAAEIVFMGNYLIDQALGLDNAEPIQYHYSELLLPGGQKNGMGNVFMGSVSGDIQYKVSTFTLKNDDKTKAEFMKNAKEDLEEGGWGELIK